MFAFHITIFIRAITQPSGLHSDLTNRTLENQVLYMVSFFIFYYKNFLKILNFQLYFSCRDKRKNFYLYSPQFLMIPLLNLSKMITVLVSTNIYVLKFKKKLLIPLYPFGVFKLIKCYILR